MFYWKDNKKPTPKVFNPRDENWVEIGNDVLMQYIKDKKENYSLTNQRNIDFGGGVERTLAVLNGFDDNYLTEIWQPIIKEIEKISHKKYEDYKKEMRIIADHIKAAVFILGDENSITPTNIGQGYVLRRLIRRAIRYGKILNIEINFTTIIAERVIEIYRDYDNLIKNKEIVLREIDKEELKFRSTVEKGIRQFEKLAQSQNSISGKEAFLLFQSFGFPIEMTIEMGKERNIDVDKKGFEEEYKKHQELSRTISAGTFK